MAGIGRWDWLGGFSEPPESRSIGADGGLADCIDILKNMYIIAYKHENKWKRDVKIGNIVYIV